MNKRPDGLTGLVFNVEASVVITLPIDAATKMSGVEIERALAERFAEQLRDGEFSEVVDHWELISVEPL